MSKKQIREIIPVYNELGQRVGSKLGEPEPYDRYGKFEELLEEIIEDQTGLESDVEDDE